MITNLIFDMGQVLVRWDPARLVATLKLNREDSALLEQEVYRSVEWAALDRGRLSLEQACESICARLPERLHPAAEELIFRWWKKGLEPIDGMDELVHELKAAGYGLYLLSNVNIQLPLYYDRVPGHDCFKGRIMSAEHLLVKPQHEIYELLYSTFALRPEECLFIDDSPTNIDGAACTGMDGILFRGSAERLRRELQGKGIRIGK